MMFKDGVILRTILQTLSGRATIQNADRAPESAEDLLARLDGDASEEVHDLPALDVAGINSDGGLVFVKTRKQETKSVPVWVNLNVPPPDRFRFVPYDPTAVCSLLSELVDVPSGRS